MKLFVAFLILTTPSLFAQEWEDISLRPNRYISAASSELDDGQDNEEGINYKYGAGNLFDHNKATAWVEGVKGDGIGESVYVVIPNDCVTLKIFAGYGKSPAVYSSNNRVKRIKLSCYIGINPEGGITELDWLSFISQRFPGEFHIDLKDTADLQTFTFPFSVRDLYEFRQKVTDRFNKDYGLTVNQIRTILQIEIEEVYKGSKWDDTCISELLFSSIRNGGFITRIYADEKNQSAVLFDTKQKRGNTLVSDSNFVYTVMDTIGDNEWVLVERAPARAGEGRVETEEMVYYVPEIKEIPLPFSPLAFESKNGINYLLGNDDKIYPLSDLLYDSALFIPEQKEGLIKTDSTGNRIIGKDEDKNVSGGAFRSDSQGFRNTRAANVKYRR